MQINPDTSTYGDIEPLQGRNEMKRAIEEDDVVIAQGSEENLKKLQDALRKAEYKKVQ